MANCCILNPLQLKQHLEKAIPNFAYQMIVCEMIINQQKNYQSITMSEIIKLMDIYMNGVQVLESSSDPRFPYFCRKIQQLMRKKAIVQQIHFNSTGKQITKQAFYPIKRLELEEKKQQHQTSIFLRQGLYDKVKIQNILKTAETKMSHFYGKMSFDIKKQEDRLQERLSRRKMKSETGSVNKFKFEYQNQQSPKMNKKQDINQQNWGDRNKDVLNEYFNNDQPYRARKGSVQKMKSNKLQSLIY